MTARQRSLQGNMPRNWEHIPDTFGAVEDINDALVIREQDCFLLTDAAGEVPGMQRDGYGLYARDCRHLSRYQLLLDEAAPVVLLSTAESGFSQEQVLGNHRSLQDGKVVGRCTVELTRQRALTASLQERLRITNYNPFPVTAKLRWLFAADFADIFEVRGHQRIAPGKHSTPEVTADSICYRYWGADGLWRHTQVQFAQPPDQIDGTGAAFDLTLAPRQSLELSLRIEAGDAAEPRQQEGERSLHREYRDWHESFAQVHTDNEAFNQVLSRSLTDLRMLWTRDRQGHGYFAAGTPWFATLFGRDSIITSLQALPFRPDIARQCLTLLARHQGQSLDAVRSEEPGKILHEVRQDELSAIGELPYSRYYGSVDSTPLFLLLAGEYFHWTADRDFIEGLLPAIGAALRWVHDYGRDGPDGFIRHRTDSAGGLRNQGWKDSVEAIVHADGRLCEGAIALAEVQGYVYAAFQRLAPVFEALREPNRAAELRQQAQALRRRFNQAFWLPEQKLYAMALDGDDRPANVMSSNAGQALLGGIVNREHAHHVRDALFRNEMFSGWGIRTLTSDCLSYNPLGYHVGTVWPHDNGLIAAGLKRYGYDDEVNEIATALFDAARQFPSSRLPELFGGQPRSEFQPPVPYPVACRPQAWTAGTSLHLLQSMLGLYPDAEHQRLNVISPKLPYWLRSVHLNGIAVGEGRADLHFYAEGGRTFVDVQTEGDLSVLLTSNWRRFFDDA